MLTFAVVSRDDLADYPAFHPYSVQMTRHNGRIGQLRVDHEHRRPSMPEAQGGSYDPRLFK